jgi:adenylate cyclase
MKRRLAAILAADVVAYSTLMNEDEAGTLTALRAHRSTVFNPAVASHGGRVFKVMGDGALVEFPSVVEAVEAALAIQQQTTAGDGHIQLRIGINLGDVIVDGDDMYGDGVNVAARLEAMAKPGGICISGIVQESVGNKVEAAFADGGEHEVKGLPHPIRVWRWPADAAEPRSRAGHTQDAIPIILVEEFSHSGDAKASAELAEELRSEIVDALAHRTGVRVAMPTEGGGEPTYVLKSRCRVAGERCRLHLSLTIAANGESFWSTKIDREITDLFGFLDEAVAEISSALRTHINAYAGAVYAAHPDEDLTVQQLLSKAAFHFYRTDMKSVAISRKTMAAAIAQAPENPMALAMQAYAIMQTVPMALERVEDIDADAAISFADRSVNHGSNIDFTFRNRGRIRLWLRRDHEGCRADVRRSLAINPFYHMAREDQALADVFGGHIQRGIDQLETLLRTAEIEPWHTPYQNSMLGLAYALTGNNRAAIDYARNGYEQRPLVPIHALAYAAAASGDSFLAQSAAFRAMIDHHELTIGDADRFPFGSESDTAAVAEMLRRSGLRE